MTNKKIDLKLIVITALMSAFICVCSLIQIPILSVPITLQVLGIYLSLFVLGGKWGSAAVALYILIGALGLPVFSGFSGGIHRLFDATGGYIMGFVFSALIYWAFVSLLSKYKYRKLISAFFSLISIYMLGTLWYAFVYLNGAHSIPYVLSVCVLPFLIPDALKILLAYIISERLSAIIKIRY